MKLLDTSVAVDHLRGHEQATRIIEESIRLDQPLLASELVRFELLSGARPTELPALEDFFGILSWVPVTDDVARLAGALARRYRAAFSGIGTADYLIAATSLLLEAPLLTTNVRDFPMLEGLTAPY